MLAPSTTKDLEIILAEVISHLNPVIAKNFIITPEDVKAKCREEHLVFIRQIFWYIAKDLTPATLQGLGNFTGGRHHTTVLHGLDKIRDDFNFINREYHYDALFNKCWLALGRPAIAA